MPGSTSVFDAIKLPSLPLFGALKKGEYDYLLDGTRREHYKKGELIHSHSGSCIGMLLVEKGRICATMLSGEGREAMLFRLTEGDSYILSEACILRQVNFDVHIEAEQDTTALIIPAQVIETLTNSNLEFKSELYRMAALRFSEVLRNLQGMLFEHVDTRIARFLLEEDKLSGSSGVLKLTHEGIAKYVGSAREVVTRTLTRLADEGAVTLGRGKVTIVDKAKLLALT